MNSLLTFRGQVLLSKATAFFILRDFGNACLRRLFLLYSYLSIHPPNAKANKTVLYFRWHYSLFNVAAAYCNSTFPLCHLLREACLLDVQCQCLHLFIIHYCTCTSQLEFPLFHVSINVFSVMAHVDDKYLQWFSPFSRYGCFDNCFILRGVRLPQAYIPLLVVHAPFLNLFFRSHSFFQCKFSVMLR